MVVTEGDVVPAGVANLVGEDRRRALRPLALLVEEAVPHGQAPAPVVAPRDVGEGPERGLVLFHGAAPHDRIELGKLDRLAVELADHVDVARPGREVVPVVDGVRPQRVVVAGQDDHRLAQPIELGPHERDGLVGHAVVIEEVAGDQQQIDLVGQGAVDDALEDAPAALEVRGLLLRPSVAVAVEMDVGGVKHASGVVWWGHGQQHATSAPRRRGPIDRSGRPRIMPPWRLHPRPPSSGSARSRRPCAPATSPAAARCSRDDAVAFGTWARAVSGLDNIVREQWQNVWPRIRDFHFDAGRPRPQRPATAPGSPRAGRPRPPAPTAARSPARAGAPSCWSGATGGGSPCTATSPCCPPSPRRPTGGFRTPPRPARTPAGPLRPRGRQHSTLT